ncbi:formylglycine-generating enzyme family protein [Tenacibaculum sp. nBUS_03]|uniref:formylglycine-generating enzyme family protein n=1 Tax=Tenacibaculum sp. nBUS_03 TaxID=3395320 RepID=UPI003EBFB139
MRIIYVAVILTIGLLFSCNNSKSTKKTESNDKGESIKKIEVKIQSYASKVNENSTVEIDWIDVPAGNFVMGSPEDELQREYNEVQRKVSIKAFKISKYEITFDQYDAFCDATGREKPKDEDWGRGKRPVINVGWQDAKDFAEWVGARLPTEAEWEYACRAGTTTRYNVGDSITREQANFMFEVPGEEEKYIGGDATVEVGSYPPNAWGIYDMHGNVFEWCSDEYHGPEGNNCLTYVIRGGGFFSVQETLRSARRIAKTPDFALPPLGIRLVKNK